MLDSAIESGNDVGEKGFAVSRARILSISAVAVLALALLAPAALGQSSEEPSDPSAQPRTPSSGSVAPSEVSAEQNVDAAQVAVGGPVIIMGIDAEDGGVGSHGPIGVYEGVTTNVLANVKNGGAGILVLGGGKAADDVTEFWDAVSSGTGIPVTYANGAAVGTQSFAGFAIVAVVSGDDETSDGGLTAVECQALAARQQDFFDHVNGGGGLIVFAQDVVGGAGCEYAFFGGFGGFTFTTGVSYNDIDVTPAGATAGLSDALDVTAWHDTYQTFPPFLQVLATVALDQGDPSGQVAALGGASVVIPGELVVAFTG